MIPLLLLLLLAAGLGLVVGECRTSGGRCLCTDDEGSVWDLSTLGFSTHTVKGPVSIKTLPRARVAARAPARPPADDPPPLPLHARGVQGTLSDWTYSFSFCDNVNPLPVICNDYQITEALGVRVSGTTTLICQQVGPPAATDTGTPPPSAARSYAPSRSVTLTGLAQAASKLWCGLRTGFRSGRCTAARGGSRST